MSITFKQFLTEVRTFLPQDTKKILDDPNATEESLNDLFSTGDYDTKLEVLNHPNVSSSMLNKIARKHSIFEPENHDIITKIVNHKNFNDEEKLENWYFRTKSTYIRAGIAKNPHISKYLHDYILNNESNDIVLRNAIINRKNYK